jgi:DNA-binding response OmpR family regulator
MRGFLVRVQGELAGAGTLLAALEREELSFRLVANEGREPHAWLLFDDDGGAAIARTRELRRGGCVGAIVILSCAVPIAAINAGYRAGADDWDVAPFCIESIGLRLRQMLEKRFPEATDEVPIDVRTWRDQVLVDGHGAILTEREFAIFHYLLESRDRAVREDELIREVLRTHHQDGSSVVRFHIQHLREKFWPELIWSDRGYILTLQRSELKRRENMGRMRKARRGSGKIRRVG